MRTTSPPAGPAGRPARRRRLAWPARVAVVAVVAAGCVVAPVVPLAPADAAPVPVVPEAQTLPVPEVAVPGSPPAPTAGGPGAAGRGAAAPGAVQPAEPADAVARTGAVATDDFRMVSVSWVPEDEGLAARVAASEAVVEVRVRTDEGWSGWQELGVEDAGPDPGTAEAAGASDVVATDPLWVSGGADGVDVRVTGDGVAASDDVEVTLVEPQTSPADPTGPRPAGARSASAPASSAAAATAGVPRITSRAEWGADESLRTSTCTDVSYTGTPKVAFVHHTAGANDYTAAESAAIVRGIYYQHTKVQGWCDIGYNVLVDKYGQIFEGRFGGLDRPVTGAHAAGFNANSFGVSVLGNYSTSRTNSAITGALASVIAWKLGLSQTNPLGTATLVSAGRTGTSRYDGGTAVSLPVITGHRAVGFTECPGNNLWAALPELRTRVAALMREKQWELRDGASEGRADREVYYGGPTSGDVALACDWDGDGRDGIAVYSRGTWYLRGQASTGGPGLVTSYGSASMLPVCGDWDGDGDDSIGVYEPGTGLWWLRNDITGGPPDLRFQYGFRGAVPVVGDWDGVGRDGIGVYDGSAWYLRGTASAGGAGAVFGYGFGGTTPVTGDWDGDGDDSVGVYAQGQWYLRESITPGNPDRRFGYGLPTDVPVVGDWDAERTGVGVTRSWP